MAGPIDPGRKNLRFQPGSKATFAVLRPRTVQVAPSAALGPAVTVQKITPLWQTPAKDQLGRTTLAQPRDAIVRPATTPADVNH